MVVLIAHVRAIILYVVLIFTIRLMGKRQIGEMEPTELVVTMLLADLASVPMQDIGIPLVAGVVPILTVLALELMLSALSMRSIRLRKLLCGAPEILIRNYKIDQAALRRSRIHADELTELLRQKGIVDLNTVQYAILETNGTLSTLIDSRYVPAPAKDAGIKTQPQELPVTLISDGRVLSHNLPLAGKTRAWLDETLQKSGLQSRQVFLMTLEPSGKLYLVRKERGV